MNLSRILSAFHSALLCLILPSGCVGDRSAGTSTETENAIGARILAVDSVLQPWERSGSGASIATLRLDAGNFDFSPTDDSGRDLSLETVQGQRIPFEIVHWDRRASRGRIHVRIDQPLLAPGSRFKFLWKLPLGRRSDPAAVWQGITSEQKLSTTAAWVDDFEGPSLLHSLLPISSFWFLGGAIPSSGRAASGSGRSDTSLHLVCAPSQCDTGRQVLAATLLASTPRSLRSLDSIAFWARGNGRIWITFEHLDSTQLRLVATGRLDSLQPIHTWASRDLGGAWTRIRLTPSDFGPSQSHPGDVGWEAIRDSVNYLTFRFEGGTELWIDEIRIHGINSTDLR